MEGLNVENFEIKNKLDEKFSNNLQIENEQNKFLNSNLGKIINTTIDLGLRWIMPDFIENQLIDIKNALIKGGLKEGIDKAIESSIELGKSFKGVVTGNFEDIAQAQNAIKNGGIIDGISNVIDSSLNMASKNGLINRNVSSMIRKGKNVILDNISNNIEENFAKQINNVEKLGKYENNWIDYYNKQDFEGMEREYNKIKDKLKETLPLEKTLREARVIENLHILIKNNGQNFNLSQNQIELSKMLNK